MNPSPDLLVLLDEEGNELGAAPRSAVHGGGAATHLAFSCHVLRTDGHVLVSRRAPSPRDGSGLWANSFCGHPEPAETLIAAVRRRAEVDLGLRLGDIRLERPLLRYRATDSSGAAANELHPIYVTHAISEPQPNTRDILELAWADPLELAATIRREPASFSPWLAFQAELLPLFGAEPRREAAERHASIA